MRCKLGSLRVQQRISLTVGLPKICANPQKVINRAKELTEDIAIASQIPIRKKRDRQDFEPISPAQFYDVPEMNPARNPHGMAPRPKPAMPAPIINPYLAVEPPAVAGPSRLGISRPTSGLRHQTHPNGSGPSKQPEPAIAEVKTPKCAIIVEGSPPHKKSRIAQPSPYLATPSQTASSTYTSKRCESQFAKLDSIFLNSFHCRSSTHGKPTCLQIAFLDYASCGSAKDSSADSKQDPAKEGHPKTGYSEITAEL